MCRVTPFLLNYFSYFVWIVISSQTLNAQHYSVGIGTDIPYQHYLSFNIETNYIDANVRTGILAPPYSDAILSLIAALGVEQIYTDLIEASFQTGWMNSIGGFYKFGKNKRWYTGIEFRYDYLTAADTPKDLLEIIIDRPINNTRPNDQEVVIKLGISLLSTGIRIGYQVPLDKQKNHYFRAEFSFSKQIGVFSNLLVNGNSSESINELLNDYLWEDVFKDYGFLGGLGIAYSYKF